MRRARRDRRPRARPIVRIRYVPGKTYTASGRIDKRDHENPFPQRPGTFKSYATF